jgi:hypothetical protein
MAASWALAGLALVASVASDAASGGYQSFIDSYASNYKAGLQDYQQYMKTHSAVLDGSQNYQQYMKTYAAGGNFSSSSSAQGYQESFEKYMHLGGANASSSSQDYQKYFQHYLGGHGNSQSYRQYQSKYASGGGSDYQKYMRGYMPANATSKLQQSAEGMECNPSECTTAKCLCTWHKNRVGVLKATVPLAFANFSVAAAEKEYGGMLADFAANRSTSVAKLGLSASCQPKEVTAVPAATLALAESKGTFLLIAAAVALPAFCGSAVGALVRLLRHGLHFALEDGESDKAYSPLPLP